MNLLIVGLGNPGRQYDKTRHNVGFEFIEAIASKLNIKLKKRFLLQAEIGSTFIGKDKIFLVKPLTYMNNSGSIFPKLFSISMMKSENLIVICDNMDLPVGETRLKFKGSSGGQKGLLSIISAIKSEKFARLYIGVGRPIEGDLVVDHVLSRFSSKEARITADLISETVNSILKLKELEAQRVVCEINSKKT